MNKRDLLSNLLMVCQIVACIFGIYGYTTGTALYTLVAAAVLFAEEVIELLLRLQKSFIPTLVCTFATVIVGHLLGGMPIDANLFALSYVVTSTIFVLLGCAAKIYLSTLVSKQGGKR